MQFNINLATSVTAGRVSTLVRTQCHCVITASLLKFILDMLTWRAEGKFPTNVMFWSTNLQQVYVFSLVDYCKIIFISCVSGSIINAFSLIL